MCCVSEALVLRTQGAYEVAWHLCTVLQISVHMKTFTSLNNKNWSPADCSSATKKWDLSGEDRNKTMPSRTRWGLLWLSWQKAWVILCSLPSLPLESCNNIIISKINNSQGGRDGLAVTSPGCFSRGLDLINSIHMVI